MADQPGGVFIGKGWSIRVPAGGLTIRSDVDGNLTMDPVQLEVMVEFWPQWLLVAAEHAQRAENSRSLLLKAVEAAEPEAQRAAVLDELQAGLVAIAACAIVWDGLHDAVLRRLQNVPTFAADTPRWRRVPEVMNRGFKFSNAEAQAFRSGMHQLFRLRNRSVHPNGDYEPTYTHELHGLGLALVFHEYGPEVARSAVVVSMRWIRHMAEHVRSSEQALNGWAATLIDIVDDAERSWPMA